MNGKAAGNCSIQANVNQWSDMVCTKNGCSNFLYLLPRGVFPRIRLDMLLHIGWYKLIGLSFVNIFIALGLVYAGVLGPGGIL